MQDETATPGPAPFEKASEAAGKEPVDHLDVVVAEGKPMRLDKALAEAVGETLSRSRLRSLIEAGHVARLGATPHPKGDERGEPVRDPALKVRSGERFRINLPPARESVLAPEAIPLDILFEDEDLVVIDKPAGMVVHPAPGAESGTLVHALLHHCGDSLSGIGGVARPGIVHRLDKDTSGLIVVAKNDAAHRALAAQFADRTAGRRYLALVHGVPSRADPRLGGLTGVAFEPGGIIRIAGNIGRHPKDRQRMAVLKAGGRPAVTRMRLREALGDAAALVECKLDTGRTHQIRVHAAHVGHPVIGDPVYGRRRFPASLGPKAQEAANAFPRQALHAAELTFRHPESGRRMTFEAPLPTDMATLLETLRKAVASQGEGSDLEARS